MTEPADEPPPAAKPAGCPSGGKQEEPGPFDFQPAELAYLKEQAKEQDKTCPS